MAILRRSVYEQSGTQVFLDPLVDTTYMGNGVETSYINKCKLYFTYNSNVAPTICRISVDIDAETRWMNILITSYHNIHTGVNIIENSIAMYGKHTNTYRVRVEVTNKFGTYYSNYIYLTNDRDGNIYNTMNYNGVLWTLENLRTTKFNDGTDITLGSTQSDTTPYYYEYPNPDDSTKSLVSEHPLFGRLYNFPCVETGKLAPTGWRVPSDEDWTNLTNYLKINKAGEYAGTKLINRVTGVEEQNSVYAWNNASGANRPGDYTQANRGMNMFGAIPAGGYYGTYNNLGEYHNIWSSTQNNGSAYVRNLFYNGTNISRGSGGRIGCSVRLCRDIGSLPQ